MPHSTHQTLSYSIENSVAHVEIDRADSLNSLTREVFEDLVEVGLTLRDTAEIKAVVLSGRGRAFSAGLDFSEFARFAEVDSPAGDAAATSTITRGAEADAPPADSPAAGTPTKGAVEVGERLGAARALAQKAVHVWSLVPVPVIAAINGAALGGGMQIALGADIRVAHPESQFSMMEIKWGIIPDMCGTQILPRLVGPGRAKKLIMTGEAISGQDACEMGIVEELAEDPVDRALHLARDFADKSRPALVWAKSLVDMSYSADLPTGLDAEQTALAELLGSPEQREALESQLARLLRKRS